MNCYVLKEIYSSSCFYTYNIGVKVDENTNQINKKDLCRCLHLLHHTSIALWFPEEEREDKKPKWTDPNTEPWWKNIYSRVRKVTVSAPTTAAAYIASLSWSFASNVTIWSVWRSSTMCQSNPQSKLHFLPPWRRRCPHRLRQQFMSMAANK